MTNTMPSRLRLLSSPEPSDARSCFTDALEAFGRRLTAEGRSENTISAYLRDLSYLSDTLLRNHPGTAPDEVTSAMIDEALTSPLVAISARGSVRSPASMHRLKAAVRSFFTWAEQNGIVRENPAGSLTLRRLPRTPPKFLDRGREAPSAQGTSRQGILAGGPGSRHHRTLPRDRHPAAGTRRPGHRGRRPRRQGISAYSPRAPSRK